MAVRFQGYRSGARAYTPPRLSTGGAPPPPSPKPANDNRPPAPVTPINPSRSVEREIAFALAQSFPQLVKLHPALRFADLLRQLLQLYRLGKIPYWKTKIAEGSLESVLTHPVSNHTGWFQNCSAGDDPAYPYFGGYGWNPGAAGAGDCGIGGQAWPRDLSGYDPSRFSENVITWMIGYFPGGVTRGYVKEQWSRIGFAEEPIMDNEWADNPAPTPELRLPWIFPELPLPHQPAVAPVPKPFDVIPRIEPQWPGERGNEAPAPELPPAPEFSPTPGANADINPYPWASRRPPQGTKDKKFRMTGFVRVMTKATTVAANVDGKLKDLRDILNALNESLPKHLQTKSKSLPDILGNVFRHLDQINASEAMLGILKEIAEDLIGGASDALAKGAAKKFGWSKQKFHLSPRF